jgi:hypothetical protein
MGEIVLAVSTTLIVLSSRADGISDIPLGANTQDTLTQSKQSRIVMYQICQHIYTRRS